MKKLLTMLSVVLMFSLLPALALADATDTGAALSDTGGGTETSTTLPIPDANGVITLEDDLVIDTTWIINDTVTLNLNNHNISSGDTAIWKDDENAWSLISVREGGNLTINGEGTLQTLKDDCYAVDVQNGATLTINGGTYVGNIHAVYVLEGSLTVNGGEFSVQQKYPEAAKADEFVLNCYDKNRAEGTATISVTGGTFAGFNPGNCKAEGEGTNFLADGFGTVADGENYVVKPAVAKIGENYYLTLQAAVNAVENGQTIEMLRDGAGGFYVGYNEDNTEWPNGTTKEFTIDFKGYKYDLASTVGSTGTKTNGVQLLKDNTVTMTNGTLYSTKAQLLIQNYCNLTLDQMTLNASGSYASSNNNGNVVIQDTTINAAPGQCAFDVYSFGSYTGANVTVKGDSVINGKIELGYDNADNSISNLKLTIESGSFNGAISASGVAVNVEDFLKGHITISGGIFSSDPSAYCADGFTGIANTNSATNSKYPFTVGEANANAAEVAPGTPEVNTDLEDQLAKNAVAALTADNAQTNITGAGLEAAAKTVAQANEVTEDEGKAALVKENVTVNDDDEVTIVVQYYMDIKITDTTEDTTAGTKTLTLDITPMAQKVATTATELTAIELTGDDQNAVKIGDPQPLTIKAPVTITLPLPADFTNENTLNVKHEKSKTKTYVYTGNVNNNVLTFTNPNGFSTFTINAGEIVAKIGEVGYETLQAAVDEVKEGETITLTQSDEAKVANKTISFYVTTENDAEATIKDYRGTVIEPKDGGLYEITRVSTGGGSHSSRNYAISIDSTKNGDVTVSPKSATKGTTVTITVDPDKGYELDDLTVTDANGKTVKLTKKNGEYTFTMPASQVSIKATFVKIDEERPFDPTKDDFTDVKASAWYAEAVKYVAENGMMKGTDGDKFAPNDNTTRGQIVTVLYRLEKEPTAGTAAFTDVAAGQYYAKAVAWAADKDIVKGYTEKTFGPNDNITREQIAAILFRYAEYKGIATKTDGNLTTFTDAAKVSAWAEDAMKWSVGCGLLQGDNGALNPQGNATRAEIAMMLMRFCENVAK